MHTLESIFLELFFLVFTSGYFTFMIVFNTLQNITFSLSEEPCSNTALWWRGITPSVKCTHHKEVSQKASLSFCLTISPFTPYPWMGSQMSLHESVHGTVSKLHNIKKNLSMWDKYTYLSRSSFTESFFPVFVWVYFLFNHSHPYTLECPLVAFSPNGIPQSSMRRKL